MEWFEAIVWHNLSTYYAVLLLSVRIMVCTADATDSAFVLAAGRMISGIIYLLLTFFLPIRLYTS